MPIGPIYKFPVPKLANGTQATTATDPSTSTIDNIRTKYAEFFGTTGISGLYGNGLKKVLDVLKTILDGNGKINSDNFSKTVEYLNGSSFYTEAQTIGGKRIDENCREGFLAYRYYLKTIAGIVSNIYNFLEAGRTALAALDGIKDSDKAHVLIIQLEIYEKFTYEAFQSLCTYYQYNADMKQWDQKINFDPNKLGSSTDKNFTTQLTVSSYNTLSDLRATQINCLDSKAGGTSKIQLNVFNSISLLDRLRYIRYYYKLIFWAEVNEKLLDSIKLEYMSSTLEMSIIKTWAEQAKSLKQYLNNYNYEVQQAKKYEDLPEMNTERKREINEVTAAVHTYVYGVDEKIGKVTEKGNDFLEKLKNKFTTLYEKAYNAFCKCVAFNTTQNKNLEDKKNKVKELKDAFYYMSVALDEISTLLTDLDLIKTDYSVFPEDANTGYPCRPDEKSTEATKDTRSLGALEMFYVGYLIDRDGPINAVASFFEVKVAALRNNLSLLSKKITALNTYLDFINRGMDVLNQSQSKKKSRIPDGAVIALTYLCGQKMYNLFEASNGNKYVVIPSAYVQDEYILVRADESGKRFLMGDCGTEGLCTGNGSCGITEGGGTYGWLMKAHTKAASKGGECWEGVTDWDTTGGKKALPRIKDGGDLSHISGGSGYFTGLGLCTDLTTKENHVLTDGATETYPFYLSGKGDKLEGTFKLPTQLEVNLIIPGSVKCYSSANDPKKEDKDGNELTLDENEHTSMIESWTNAFSNKTQYINTAIDTINTDVTVDRSKIDTFDSLTSTFRSRAHDAYTNIASNIRG